MICLFIRRFLWKVEKNQRGNWRRKNGEDESAKRSRKKEVGSRKNNTDKHNSCIVPLLIKSQLWLEVIVWAG